eukprot:m.486224 g.486224  ORF g.486224 m.486224 type:complete len:621 (+) comp24248_c0_seq1:182-2044(+)
MALLTSVAVVVVVLVGVFFLARALGLVGGGPVAPNPFATDSRRPQASFEYDEKKRDAVLKQGYTQDKVPKDADVIVIGSGMGGLSVAALLAKTGKKVVVFEQHDQAGGCLHTFIDKNIEFDTGIHYIGEMRNRTTVKYLFDQLTDGQVTWQDLEEEYDRVSLGDPLKGQNRTYPIMAGREEFRATLKERFPKEHAAIDRYLEMLDECRREMLGYIGFKFMPVWLSEFLASTGLVHWMTNYFKLASRSTAEVLESLTEDKELRAVLAYSFGDYGTLPKDSSFAMHASLISHFLYGVSYPVGGSSQFAFNMIPVIEAAGGRVLVRARVEKILVNEQGVACGVQLEKDRKKYYAPMIISDAGVQNTYHDLLEPEVVASHPSIDRLLGKVESGIACMTVYAGLDGSKEELGLKATNVWSFSEGVDQDGDSQKFLDMTLDEVLDNRTVPLLFISFPSCKDPLWNKRFPGKSTCEIVTLARWDWFEQWSDKRVKKRGDEYQSKKMALGEIMWEHVEALYPALKGKREYFDVGSPLSNNYYIASPRGEIYGLDHTLGRFADPRMAAALRPQTPIPGLLLTGQDVLNCGFVGAMFGGLLCASAATNRNLFKDVVAAKNKFGFPKQKAE